MGGPGGKSDRRIGGGDAPAIRVCVHRSKRELFEFGDYLGCYFMDDRAAITTLLRTARRLGEQNTSLAGDVYFVLTTNEEIGGVGGSYASRRLPGDLTIAVEVGPTEAEYGTTCAGDPIIAYSDAESVYDKSVADSLMHIATECGLSPQAAHSSQTPRIPRRAHCLPKQD